MALRSNLFLCCLLLASSLPAMTAAANPRPTPNLAARLQSDGLAQCWDSLMQLRSCAGEVVLFFLNGETYLGPSCCRAVRVIEHRCWAADAMLTALGFTAEEGDILRGYCDAADSPMAAPLTPPAAPAPSGRVALKGLVH